MLANPPYVRQELISAQKPVLQNAFPEVYTGTADLYCYFYALAIRILSEGGSVSFISSNKWFRAKYGEKLRQHIAASCRVRTITDFGELPVFETAATFPMIFIASKGKASKTVTVFTQVRSLDAPYPDMTEVVQQSGRKLPSDAIQGTKWALTDAASASRLRKMESSGQELGQLVRGRIFRGIVTGFNEAFVIDRGTRDRLVEADGESDAIIKPFLRGDDVRRYEMHFRESYLVFTRRGISMRSYPAILKHLSTYRSDLTPRKAPSDGRGRKPGDYKWYEIQDSIDYHTLFEEPKIMYPEIGKEGRFAMDFDSRYPADTTHIIACCDWYLLGVLNSACVFEYLKGTCAVLGDEDNEGRLRFKPIYMHRLPIPDASTKERAKVAALAEEAQRLHGQRRKRVERFLSDLSISLAESNSRNPLEQPWSLTPDQFSRRIAHASLKLFTVVRDETAALTEEIQKVEKEIDARVTALYSL